jgi:hypothetical protein
LTGFVFIFTFEGVKAISENLSTQMDKCPQCNINLHFTQLKCPVCRNYVWRLPHIIIGTVLILIVGISALLTIDYLAVNRVPDDQEQEDIILPGTKNPGGSQPLRRSNPGNPRPANKRH